MEAKLVVVSGQTTKGEVALNDLPLLIGRNRTAGLPINHQLVSRNHCEIYELGGALVVRDLGSANGTRINDEPIDEEVLRPGDWLTVGPLTFEAQYDYPDEIVPDLEELQLEADSVDDELFFDEVQTITEEPEESEESAESVVELQPTAAKKSSAAALAKPPPVFEDDAPLATAESTQSAVDLVLDDLLDDEEETVTKPRSRTQQPPEILEVQLEDAMDSTLELSDSVLEAGLVEDDASDPGRTPTVQQDEITSAIDESEDFLLVQDSEIHSLSDSGVGPAIKKPPPVEIPDAAEDSGLELELVDDDQSGSSFDAVKLLHSDSSIVEPADDSDVEAYLTPARKKSRQEAERKHQKKPDDKHAIDSWVGRKRSWEESGIGQAQLKEADQPADFRLRLQLEDAGKLAVGTPVRVAGIDVGMVTDLNWVAAGGQLRAEALLNIQQRLGEVLRDDFQISIQDPEKSPVVVIGSPGSSSTRIKNGQVVAINAAGESEIVQEAVEDEDDETL